MSGGGGCRSRIILSSLPHLLAPSNSFKLYPLHSSPSPPPETARRPPNSANLRAKRAMRARQALPNNLDNIARTSGTISTFSSESEGNVPGKHRRASQSRSRTSGGSLGQLKTSPLNTATMLIPDSSDRPTEGQPSSPSAKISLNGFSFVKTNASPARNKERLYQSSPLAPQSPTYIYNTTHNDLFFRVFDLLYNS
jgi:hypothetical protein